MFDEIRAREVSWHSSMSRTAQCARVKSAELPVADAVFIALQQGVARHYGFLPSQLHYSS